MTRSIASNRHSSNTTYLIIPGHRARGRRLGSSIAWITQCDGVVRPVTAADLRSRDALADDVSERERAARGELRDTSDPEMRRLCIQTIARYHEIQREIATLYRSPNTPTRCNAAHAPSTRRDNRRAPRRTRSARTAQATTSSSRDGEPPPEPEPPGNRRCPSSGVASVQISIEHAPDPAHRNALVDLLADLIGGGR